MCGRYAASTHPDKLIEIFEVDEVPDALPAVGPEGLAQWSRPRWNIAPTDLVPAVLERTREQGDIRLLTGLRWGLIHPVGDLVHGVNVVRQTGQRAANTGGLTTPPFYCIAALKRSVS